MCENEIEYLGDWIFWIYSVIMRLKKIISNILSKNDSELIERKEEMESEGLLGLGTRIIVENFQSKGKLESLSAALYICACVCEISNSSFWQASSYFCSYKVKIRDLLRGYFIIANFTSFGVKCLIGRDTGKDELRKLSATIILAGDNIAGWG